MRSKLLSLATVGGTADMRFVLRGPVSPGCVFSIPATTRGGRAAPSSVPDLARVMDAVRSGARRRFPLLVLRRPDRAGERVSLPVQALRRIVHSVHAFRRLRRGVDTR